MIRRLRGPVQARYKFWPFPHELPHSGLFCTLLLVVLKNPRLPVEASISRIHRLQKPPASVASDYYSINTANSLLRLAEPWHIIPKVCTSGMYSKICSCSQSPLQLMGAHGVQIHATPVAESPVSSSALRTRR